MRDVAGDEALLELRASEPAPRCRANRLRVGSLAVRRALQRIRDGEVVEERLDGGELKTSVLVELGRGRLETKQRLPLRTYNNERSVRLCCRAKCAAGCEIRVLFENGARREDEPADELRRLRHQSRETVHTMSVKVGI